MNLLGLEGVVVDFRMAGNDLGVADRAFGMAVYSLVKDVRLRSCKILR
jgi:hypothetical protein